MARHLDSDDMLFHALIVGGTGSGKTNCILYMLDLLFNKKEEGAVPPSLFLFDPAGDASIDLVRAIPRSERNRVVILDPQYVTFGFNLLSLPGLEDYAAVVRKRPVGGSPWSRRSGSPSLSCGNLFTNTARRWTT